MSSRASTLTSALLPGASSDQLAALDWLLLLVLLPFSAMAPPLKSAAAGGAARVLPEAETEMEMLVPRPLPRPAHCCGAHCCGAHCCGAAAGAPEEGRRRSGEAKWRMAAGSTRLRWGGGGGRSCCGTALGCGRGAQPRRQAGRYDPPLGLPAGRGWQPGAASLPPPPHVPRAPVVGGQRLPVLHHQRGQQRVQVGHVGRPAAAAEARAPHHQLPGRCLRNQRAAATQQQQQGRSAGAQGCNAQAPTCAAPPPRCR
jgi:hypothetical protein